MSAIAPPGSPPLRPLLPITPPTLPSPVAPPTLPPPLPLAPPWPPGGAPGPPPSVAAHVNSTVGLTDAILDDAIGHIVLMPGTYEFDPNINGTCSGNRTYTSWYCINRALTIEAAEPGTVELNAKEQRRVFHLTGTGIALIGLIITGGIAVPLGPSDGFVGGGVLVEGGEASLMNCNIVRNRAVVDATSESKPNAFGGGVYVDDLGRVSLVGCNVSHNNASDGAGLSTEPGSVTNLTECRIFSNTANVAGFGFGGGLLVKGNCTMTSCQIFENSALHLGGGLALIGGGSASLDGCTISKNNARDGGGVSSSGVLRMVNCALRANRASATNRVEANQPDVGGWGGSCTCGDGETYQVGDNNDGCGSLACVGGTSGICKEVDGPGAGVRVTCGNGRGGGIFAAAARPVSCTRCTLSGNVANEGGAALIAGTTTATFQGSYFQLNRADGGDGGAIKVIQEGELLLSDSQFEANAANSDSASAIFYQSSSTSSLVVGCTFRNHSDAAALVTSETPLTWECQLGQWSPHVGRIDANDFSGCASKCPVGTLGLSAYLTSSDECSACPAGLSTDEEGARSVTECSCPVGLYTDTPSNCSAADVGPGPELPPCVAEWKCKECPEHTRCDTPNVTLRELDVEEGYWRQSDFSSEIRRCYSAAACLGGTNVSSQCADGHQGPYCEVCMPEYFGGSLNELCTPCEDGSMLNYIPLFAVLLLLLGVVVYFKTALSDAATASLKVQKKGKHKAAVAFAAVETLASKRMMRLFPRCADDDPNLTVNVTCGEFALIDIKHSEEDIDFNRISECAAKGELQLRDKIIAVNTLALDRSFKELDLPLGRKVALLVVRPKTRMGFSARIGMRLTWSLSGKALAIKIKMKILISLYQVLGSLGFVFQITYPPWYEDTIANLSGLIQIDFPSLLPLECVWPIAFDGLLVLRTLVPLVLMGLVVALARLARNRWQAMSDRGPVICFYVLFLIYPSCCSAIFRCFACDSLPDRSRHLHADYSIDCDSAAYRGTRAYALVMFFVYPLGTPLLFYILLRRDQGLIDRISRHEYTAHAQRELEEKRGAEKMSRRRRLDTFSEERNTVSVAFLAPPELRDSEVSQEESPEWHEAEAERLRAKLSLFVKLLTDGYEMRCAKFEVFECVRKIFIVGIPVLFEEPGSNAQFMFGMLACFLSFGVYAYWMPYQDQNDDQLQAAAQIQIFCGLLSKVAYNPSSENSTLTFMLIGLILGPPSLALSQVSGLQARLQKRYVSLSEGSAWCSVPRILRRSEEAQRSGGEVRPVGHQRRPLSTFIRIRKQPSSDQSAHGQELTAIRESSRRDIVKSCSRKGSASSSGSSGSSPGLRQGFTRALLHKGVVWMAHRHRASGRSAKELRRQEELASSTGFLPGLHAGGDGGVKIDPKAGSSRSSKGFSISLNLISGRCSGRSSKRRSSSSSRKTSERKTSGCFSERKTSGCFSERNTSGSMSERRTGTSTMDWGTFHASQSQQNLTRGASSSGSPGAGTPRASMHRANLHQSSSGPSEDSIGAIHGADL